MATKFKSQHGKKAKGKQRRPAGGGCRTGTPFDVVKEKVLSLTDAGQLPVFQTQGKPASSATMNRHRLNGLECMWRLRGWITSEEAIQRYFEKLSATDKPLSEHRAARTQHATATAELASQGI